MCTVKQERLEEVIDGIEDEDDEVSIKLSESLLFEMQLIPLNRCDRTFVSPVFAILAQRDEMSKLKLREERQTQANLEKIKGGRLGYPKLMSSADGGVSRGSVSSLSVKDLENKVEEFKQQIKDKTQMLDSSSVRISDLCKRDAVVQHPHLPNSKSGFLRLQRLKSWNFTRASEP